MLVLLAEETHFLYLVASTLYRAHRHKNHSKTPAMEERAIEHNYNQLHYVPLYQQK
jgi:hypothetical protein